MKAKCKSPVTGQSVRFIAAAKAAVVDESERKFARAMKKVASMKKPPVRTQSPKND